MPIPSGWDDLHPDATDDLEWLFRYRHRSFANDFIIRISLVRIESLFQLCVSFTILYTVVYSSYNPPPAQPRTPISSLASQDKPSGRVLVHMHEYTEELKRFEANLRKNGPPTNPNPNDPTPAKLPPVPMTNVACVGLMLPNYITSSESGAQPDDWEMILKNEDQLYDNMMSYIIAPLTARAQSAPPRRFLSLSTNGPPATASTYAAALGASAATLALTAGLAVVLDRRYKLINWSDAMSLLETSKKAVPAMMRSFFPQ